MFDDLASALREKIEILTLERDEETGALSWVSERKRWAAVKLDSQRNLFSAVGVGARGVTVTIRPDRRLTLRDAIRWNGEFLHLTAISMDAERDRQEIRAAICHPETLTAKPQDRTGRDARNRPVAIPQAAYTFPGILAERYYRSEEDEVFRRETLERVLVTPKAVELRTGDLIQQGDSAPYTVLQRLDLEDYKNEYVIERRRDA